MIHAYEIRYSYTILILKHDEYFVHYIAGNNNFPKTQTLKRHKIKKKSCQCINVHLDFTLESFSNCGRVLGRQHLKSLFCRVRLRKFIFVLENG